MFLNRVKTAAVAVALLASMSFAGSAAASPSQSSFAAQASPSLKLPLGFLNLTVGGPGLSVEANLFPKATYTPVLDLSLLKSSINVTAFVGAPAVPEPESIAMLGVGLAMVGFVAARRRRMS